ncbi:MAG: hypothetical protein QMD92_00300 [bacterium]|nr:hypothetical protein [bacterium]
MSQFSLVKAKFIEITGRADLADPAAAFDAGFFINEGQKYLDRLFSRGKVEARHFTNLTADQVIVSLQNVRSFKEVWLYDSETRSKLIVTDAATLRGYYSKPTASLDKGPPEYYAPIVIRPFPKDLSASGLNQAWAVEDMKLTTHETYNAILLKPPVDVSGKYTLEVHGTFYTDALSGSTDKSYWTETNELLLIFAAAFMMELSYRNTEGAKDWKNAVLEITEELDKDIVEEQITDISSMEVKVWDTPS